jgi:hypothetical protein
MLRNDHARSVYGVALLQGRQQVRMIAVEGSPVSKVVLLPYRPLRDEIDAGYVPRALDAK